MTARVAGELASWPPLEELAEALRAGGLNVRIGRHSIRVEDCGHFVFQELGGPGQRPSVDADAETVATLRREARLVSAALAKAGIRHRFELYDKWDEPAGYLHHDWPNEAGDDEEG